MRCDKATHVLLDRESNTNCIIVIIIDIVVPVPSITGDFGTEFFFQEMLVKILNKHIIIYKNIKEGIVTNTFAILLYTCWSRVLYLVRE